MEIVVVYGYNVVDSLSNFKIKCKKEIEKLTSMNVEKVEIVAKGIYMPEKSNDGGNK